MLESTVKHAAPSAIRETEESDRRESESNRHPDILPPQLALEPVQRLTAHRRATTGRELEPPAVRGADRLAVLDPPVGHHAVGMGAASQQGVDRLTVTEYGEPQPVDHDGSAATIGHVFDSAGSAEFGHGRGSGEICQNEKIRTCIPGRCTGRLG